MNSDDSIREFANKQVKQKALAIIDINIYNKLKGDLGDWNAIELIILRNADILPISYSMVDINQRFYSLPHIATQYCISIEFIKNSITKLKELARSNIAQQLLASKRLELILVDRQYPIVPNTKIKQAVIELNRLLEDMIVTVKYISNDIEYLHYILISDYSQMAYDRIIQLRGDISSISCRYKARAEEIVKRYIMIK